MRVERLRPAHDAETLAAMYAAPHDHRIYGRGHHERVEATIELACRAIPEALLLTVGDLSCGNGEIARRICTDSDGLHLGDAAVQLLDVELPGVKYHGPLEETIHLMPEVDTYVCSETLEHLDDPGKALALIRTKATYLLLSTPLECWGDTNGEHYWAWDREGVEDLMQCTGWIPVAFDSVDSREWGEPYLYGIWVAS
jgi:hypothetical protein